MDASYQGACEKKKEEMLAVAAFFTLVVILGISLLRWRQKTFSYFKDLGIPGPKPNLLWGNLWEYHKKGFSRSLDKWCKEYGDIFGFYNGDVPMLVVKDLEFLKYVFVKNFSNFTDRGMLDHIAEVSDVFLDVLGKKADQGKEINVLETMQALTMDYIGRAAFGVDTSFQKDVNNPFLITTKRTLRGVMTGPFHMLAQSTTSLGVLAAPIFWLNRMFGTFSFLTSAEETAKVIELRRKNPELRRNDILQNLIDAEYEEQAAKQTSSDKSTNGMEKGLHRDRTLSSEKIIQNSTVLFVAGFETTASALSYLTFALGKYPDVQDKVRREAQEVLSNHGKLDYETITQKMKYVGQVINETMRIWPPALTFTTRQAKEDFEYKGIKYKAGTCIMSPTLQIHRDERFFPDPMKFDPDRFSEENEGSISKIAFQPFGIGPRNCAGMRLALLEIAYTVVKMTQHFRWELGASQLGELPLEQYAALSTPARGPWIIFHKI